MRTTLLIALLALGACASNSDRSANSNDTVRAKQYESEKQALSEAGRDDVVCTYERTVGSHLKKSICMTAAEREKRADADRAAAERTRRNRNASTSGGEADI